MTESYTEYRIPSSQMEDVPIDNRHPQHYSKSEAYYEKSKRKPVRCLNIANHWDFFMHYKITVFTGIISIVVLLLFSASIIYMAVQSVDRSPAIHVQRPIEEEPVSVLSFFNDINAEEIDRHSHTIPRQLYHVVSDDLTKTKSPEVHKMEKRAALLVPLRNFESLSRNNEKLYKIDTEKENARAVEMISKDPEVLIEMNENNVDDEHRKNDKRELDVREKMRACQRTAEHCRMLLESMESLVEKTADNVDSLNKMVKQARFQDTNYNDKKFQDYLQCVECGKIARNDSVAFHELGQNNAAAIYDYLPYSQNGRGIQMRNMSGIASLLDISDSEETEKIDGNTQKSEISPTGTQKLDPNIQKTVQVSKSKKVADGTLITQIIKNTTIIQKKLDEESETEKQETQMPPEHYAKVEVSTANTIDFNSLKPIRQRPMVQMQSFPAVPSDPQSVPKSFQMTEEKNPVLKAVQPDNVQFSQGWSREGKWEGKFEPRIMTGTQFQPTKNNLDGNPMIVPTAETMKTSQQVQYTPSISWSPYPVCFFGSPPSGSASGPMKQSMPGAMTFPESSPGVASYPQAGAQFPMQGTGFQSQMMSQGFIPMQFPQQQGLQFSPVHQFQQGNIVTGFQQGQRVGPTGPGGQNFMPNIGNQPSGPGRTPYYCTYLPAPTFQFPVIPGISEFQRSANNPAETVRSHPKQNNEESYENVDQFGPENVWNMNEQLYPGISEFQQSLDNPVEIMRSDPKQNTVPDYVWNVNEQIYPGYRKECDQNSRRCEDGSRCVPKTLWCDGSVDCSDASDEINCSCRDRVSKDRICDGYFDCPRGEDELGCFGCPSNSFSCEDWSRRYRRENCVPLTQRCDGLHQCQNGKDEMDCNILTQSYIENQDIFTVGYTNGYLHKNWRGRWYPVCSRTESWAMEACLAETGSAVRELPQLQIKSIPRTDYPGPYLAQSQKGEIKLVPTCFDKTIYVKCPEIPCGTRVFPHQETYSSYGQYEDTLVANSRDQSIDQNEVIGNNFKRDVKEATNGTENEILGSESRVVGGRASQPKAWPFLVAIYKNGYFHCGGAVIDRDWVLTAAHCVDGFPAHYYEIQAGLLRRFSFSPMAQTRRAKYIKMHPSFDKVTMKNDLALIRLNEPLNFNRWIRPTCLPGSSTTENYWRNGPFPETTCVTIGWGATVERGPDPDHLREVEVPILRECKHIEDRNDAEICAGLPQGGRDACQGDSGGPLMCQFPNVENQWYVAGIVSHGEGCARPNEPGAYTKVSRFVDWINDVIRTSDLLVLGPKPLEICPGFSCAAGLGKCIPLHKRCDRTVNCLDAEDEVNCRVYKKTSAYKEAENDGNVPQSYFSDSEMVGQITPIFSEDTEKQDEITTSRGSEKHSVFTMEDDEKPSTSATQKNITDATSVNGTSSQQPIITTSKPQSSSQQPNETDEPLRFTCTKLIQTIPNSQRCNRVLDCEDGTDEDNCTCKDYLVNLYPTAICDGHVDCYDGSDEDNCAFCDESQFICSRSRKCIPQSKMCDHYIDCPYMEDELDCFALTNGNYVIMDLDNRPHLNLEGVVTQRRNGKWRPACQSHNTTIQTRLSNEFCVYFGFGMAESVEEIRVKDSPIEVKISTKENVIPYEYPPSYTRPNDSIKSCDGLYVRCKPVLSSNTSSLTITNPVTGNVTYLWPWQASIFVDGQYNCPAVLLEDAWLLASSRCVENIDLRNNYTMAVLGTSPTYLFVDGPHQQTAAIDSIKLVKKLDAALLHLEYPSNMTRYVQPIFIQKKIFPATTRDVCVATGVDDQFHTKTTFLQSVPQQCAQCHRCYKNATVEDCRNKNSTKWSGTIVCRGPGIWYPAAIFDDKDIECGFQSVQTLSGIDYGNAHFTEVMDEEFTPTKGPNCDGLRCALGKCVPWTKVCDGIDDCRDGGDENSHYCGKQKELCNNSNGIGCKCGKSELRCRSGQCVPKEAFCDFKIDCDDGSDETPKCTCADYLKLTAPERLCDNVRDCFDKSDESNEHCLCKDASFKCTSGLNVTETCVSQDFVCDGETDCANGEDERTCRIVKGTLKDPPGTGQVLRRSYGVWHSECFASPLTSTNEASEICRSMGYLFGKKLDFENDYNPYGPPLVASRDDFFVIRMNPQTWITMRNNRPLVTIVPATEPCHRAFVKCS